MNDSESKHTICVDFDGVIHSYKSGWKGIDRVSDEPVVGAFKWLHELIHDGRFEVMIYSSRSKTLSGREAMKKWFSMYGFSTAKLQFPSEKPAAWLTIDDRAICFTGVFPTLDEILDFKPWYK